MHLLAIAALVGMFSLGKGKLICDGKAIIDVPKDAKVYFDRNFEHAAVVDLGTRMVSVFVNCDKKLVIPITWTKDAIIPTVLFNERGFLVVQPSILKVQLFSFEGVLVASVSQGRSEFLSEPYIEVALASDELVAVIAYRKEDSTIILSLTEDGSGKSNVLKDLYPAGLWILDQDVFVRVLRIEDMHVKEDKIVRFRLQTLIPKDTLEIEDVSFVTRTDGLDFFVSKRGHVTVLKHDGSMNDFDLGIKSNEVVVGLWGSQGAGFILAGTPELEGSAYKFKRIKVFKVGFDGVIGTFELPDGFEGSHFGVRFEDSQKIVVINEFGGKAEVLP